MIVHRIGDFLTSNQTLSYVKKEWSEFDFEQANWASPEEQNENESF